MSNRQDEIIKEYEDIEDMDTIGEIEEKIASLRLNKPQHVKRLLNQEINKVRKAKDMGTESKARVIGYLSNILLKSLEMGEMSERMEYVYKHLKEQERRR